jgi:hypothetical protein
MFIQYVEKSFQAPSLKVIEDANRRWSRPLED